MIDEVAKRRPHAVLDLPSRRLKGRKIERLLDLGSFEGPIKMLEVGTGSGGIASFLGTHSKLNCDIDSVDIVDSRLVHEGYRFQKVDSVALPFADNTFDIVLSNHVIEHVGDDNMQARHLEELRRVLKQDGIGYLAVPNRWMLIEPHYHLAFLSWWPERWRTPYLRLMGYGEFYDCRPLSAPALHRALGRAALYYRNISIDALHATLEIEDGHKAARMIAALTPDSLLSRLAQLSPTLIYLFACRSEIIERYSSGGY